MSNAITIEVPEGATILVNGQPYKEAVVSSRFKPEEDEDYFYFNDNGYIHKTTWCSSASDHNRYFNNNIFRTKKLAQESDTGQKFISDVRDWLAEKNEGWEPDFDQSNLDKYYIAAQRGSVPFEVMGLASIQFLPNWKYAKSHEIIKALLKKFDNEMLKKWWING